MKTLRELKKYCEKMVDEHAKEAIRVEGNHTTHSRHRAYSVACDDVLNKIMSLSGKEPGSKYPVD